MSHTNVGFRTELEQYAELPPSWNVPAGRRDAADIKQALDSIDGWAASEDNSIGALCIKGEPAYVDDYILGTHKYGRLYSFRRVINVSGQTFLCVKTFHRDEDFDKDKAVINALHATPHESAIDLVIARAVELRETTTAEPRRLILMEYGDGSLADFCNRLTAKQAVAFVIAMLKELRRTYVVTSLIGTDTKPENFLYSVRHNGQVLVHTCDYAGYVPENTRVRRSFPVHPLVDLGEEVVANVANCVFQCGVVLLQLMKYGPPDLLVLGASMWSAMEHSVLRKIMRTYGTEGNQRVAAAVHKLVRYNSETDRFEETFGDGAKPATFDDAIA